MADLTGPQIAAAFRYATDWLGVYREQVNALNVYPVPDGDTGTNMHLTLQSVRRELDTCDENDLKSVARAISYGALLGARGNSGVILSQLLKGFADAIGDLKRVSASQLAHALQSAQKCGYRAVMKPVEGTILTVAREAAAGAKGATPQAVLENALSAGQQSLERTPELLPALKQAGVVDSGGQGYLYVLEGMLGSLTGRALPEAPQVQGYAGEQFGTENFGYCTEFLMEKATLPIEQIRELVVPFGDSLLVVGAEGFVKGHIHTNEPDALLATVGRHGAMLRTKVEDMSLQHTEILAMAGATARAEAEKPASALVAVASGDGMIKLFRSLGARIVPGGQTQNPSVQDIVDAARSVSAHEIVILPNNKNVLLAAEKASELLEGARVLPTRTLGQGVAAALAFKADVPAGEQLEALQQAANAVTTFEVTRASRAASVNGLDIQAGDVIGLRDDELVHAGGSPEDAVLDMLRESLDGQEVVTVFTGPDVDGEALVARIAGTFPDLDVELHGGGPELYDYLVTLE